MSSCCQEASCVLQESCNDFKCTVACCHGQVIIQSIDNSKREELEKKKKKGKKFSCIWCCCFCLDFCHHEDN